MINTFVGFFMYLFNTVVYTPCKTVNSPTVDRDLAIPDRTSRAITTEYYASGVNVQ
jgi:hypothetical protein